MPRRLVLQNEPNLLVKQLSAEVCPCDQPPATVPEAVFVTHSESDVPVRFTDDELPDLSADKDAADLDPPLGVMESLPGLESDLLVKQLSAEVCPCDQPPATVPEAVFVTHSESDAPVRFTDDDLPDCVHFAQCATLASCYKALIPLAKLKGLIDEIDVGDLTDFRCDVCSNCVTCKSRPERKPDLHGQASSPRPHREQDHLSRPAAERHRPLQVLGRQRPSDGDLEAGMSDSADLCKDSPPSVQSRWSWTQADKKIRTTDLPHPRG